MPSQNNDSRQSQPSLATVDARLAFVYNTNAPARSEQGKFQVNAKELTLRVVELDDVLLHEQVEKQRVERLVHRLETDRYLKNPPIVAEDQGKYVLLDGATRITALKQVGCCDAVVQVVDYQSPELVLETWNHMLIDLPVPEFLDALRQLPGLRLVSTSVDEAEDALECRDSIGTILLPDGTVYSLFGSQGLSAQAQLLNQVVEAYEGRGQLYRVAHTDLERLLAENARLSALIVFPRFHPDEIRELARNGSKLPTGITRHIIPGRAMRINIPLDVLQCDDPLGKKNAWLDEWMKSKMRERQVRYYQEPVFLFDE